MNEYHKEPQVLGRMRGKMREKMFYNAALYLRLSRDDADDIKTESDSIGSQRELIRAYIKKNEDIQIYDTYIDDGWSGANFDRPAFKRMMKDIESGKVNCVIVKDLSRLGRDYIEAGRLIQKTFPAFSVRFIAIADQYDSLTADYHETSLVLPVKNFINDSYCRDISNKVRSHQRIKRENGQFIGAFAVYGYKKSSRDKYVLEPDAYAAEVVKMIFAWKIQGYSTGAIANRLEEYGVLSPMEYKKIKRERHRTGFLTGEKARWSSVAIKRILTNEIYIGTMVQGKEEKINYKVKKYRKKPKEEWIKVEHTHPAIISHEDFFVVQRLLETDMRAKSGSKKSHKYAGLLFCGDCKQQMFHRINRCKGRERISYICAASNKGKGCRPHQIPQKELNRIIMTVLRQHMLLFINHPYIAEAVEMINIDLQKFEAFQEELEILQRQLEFYSICSEHLGEDFKKNVITEEEWKSFHGIYQRQQEEIKNTIQKQKEMMKTMFYADMEKDSRIKHIKNNLSVPETDRLTLITFVQEILIYEDKRIQIKFRYGNPFCTLKQNV